MSFKNISKYFFVSIFLFLISCNAVELLQEDEKIEIQYNDKIESDVEIFISSNISKQLIYEDFYQNNNFIHYVSESKLDKIHTFNLFSKKLEDRNPLQIFINNENIFILTSESIINVYDIDSFKLLDSIKIQIIPPKNLIYPSSILKYKQNYYISYSNGNIISSDLSGKILWNINFKDILKTPLKIHNDRIIALLSNRILSINPLSGQIEWEYYYDNNMPLQVLGGDIVDLNHLLFFILPNGRVGEIDTIFGEKNDSIFSTLIFEDSSINNSFDKLHIHNNVLSYFDQKKFLTTINLSDNSILLNKEFVKNVESFYFFNNTIFTFHKDNLLKASHINSRNLFWESDLSNIIKNENNIISIFNTSNSIVIFFDNGSIIEFDSKNGDIVSNRKINLKNIIHIQNKNDILFFYQSNGKISLFK